MIGLAKTIDAHPGAFEYDWRARFHLPLRVIGTGAMTWGEALRLTHELAADPTSRVGAALSDLDRPVSRDELMVMDLFDLTHQIAWRQGGGKGSKPKPYPRPFRLTETKTRTAPAAEVTQEQVLAALRFAGHEAPFPTAAN